MTQKSILAFEVYLREKDRALSTIQKYVSSIKMMQGFVGNRKLDKLILLEYIDYLKTFCKAHTINSKISAINAFLKFSRNEDLLLKYLRVQRQSFVEPNKELSDDEYRRLLNVAKRNKKDWLYYLMLTLAGTGIRIGELKYITVDAVKRGFVEVSLKKKNRQILIPNELKQKLLDYIHAKNLTTGLVFRTKTGTPFDRSNINHEMKKICRGALVNPKKVFPHNFRHLFARSFYEIEKNLAHLADILGHTSIETTRIYVATSIDAYENIINKMQLIS